MRISKGKEPALRREGGGGGVEAGSTGDAQKVENVGCGCPPGE